MLRELLEDHAPRDAAMAAAYEAMGDAGRGRIKALLAMLFAVYPPRRMSQTVSVAQHDGGFVFREVVQPRPFALALLDSEFASPAKLLAALVPAITAGVGEIGIIRLGSRNFPPQLLTALELAGVEAIGAMPAPKAKELLAQVAASPTGAAGALLCFGPKSLAVGQTTPLPRWDFCPGWAPARVGVYAEATVPAATVAEELEFLHPGCEVEWWAADALAGLPECRVGSLKEFLGQDFDALVVPDQLLGQVVRRGRGRLAWGPAQAGFWLWPVVEQGAFLERSLGLGSPGEGRGGRS